jgi:hypothetical protein
MPSFAPTWKVNTMTAHAVTRPRIPTVENGGGAPARRSRHYVHLSKVSEGRFPSAVKVGGTQCSVAIAGHPGLARAVDVSVNSIVCVASKAI